MTREVSSPGRGFDPRPRSTSGTAQVEGASRILRAIVDAGLMAIVFLAPLFMGGRGEIGRLVYVSLVCGTAVACLGWHCLSVEARWRWSGLEWILSAGILLVILQLAPLPAALLQRLSPHVSGLLPLWTVHANPETQLGVWNQLSLAPQATRSGLTMLLAHGLLFIVLLQRIQSVADVRRTVRWLAVAAMGMAVLGLAQLLVGNGKFLWIYEHPFRDTYRIVRGSFQNQNHFAHLLALGIGPLVWWLHRLGAMSSSSAFGGDRSRRPHALLWPTLMIGLGLVAFAGLLTFSRGGVAAMFVAAALSLGILLRQRRLGRKSLLVLGGLTLVTAGALLIYGYEPLAARLSTVRESRSLDELSAGRRALWAALLKAIPEFAWVGSGVGSHAYIYPTYLEESFDFEFTHGESGYLHLLIETGAVGLVLALGAAGVFWFWCLGAARGWEGSENQALTAALWPGLAASLLHSLGDFVWFIPACMSMTVVLGACACRLCQLAPVDVPSPCEHPFRTWWNRMRRLTITGGEIAISRWARLAITGGLLGLGAVLIMGRLPAALAAPHWEAYFKLARDVRDADSAAELGLTDDGLAAMADHLSQALRRDPGHGRAHLRLAAICLRQFDARQQASENPMPLPQIRDAALASHFPSQAAQDRWLSLVMGDNRRLLDRALWHARQALRLCPLQGEGYVYLAELGFLHSGSPRWKHEFIEQALRVRPYSGVVLLAAGGEAALAKDNERALTLWKQAFHLDPEHQVRIIELLAPQMPPETFVDSFHPDRAALGRLFEFYRQLGAADAAQFAGGRYVAELERETAEEASSPLLWDRAGSVYAFLGDTEKAVHCARQAVLLTPDNYGRRRILAAALQQDHAYGEAVEQLQWCLARRPDDSELRAQLEQVNRARLAARDNLVRQ